MHRPDPRRHGRRGRSRMAPGPAQHRPRRHAGFRTHAPQRRPARCRFPRPLLHRVRQAGRLSPRRGGRYRQGCRLGLRDRRDAGRGNPWPRPPDGVFAHPDRRQLVGAARRPGRAALLDDHRARGDAGPDRPAGRRVRLRIRGHARYRRGNPAGGPAQASTGKNGVECNIPVARLADMLLNPGAPYSFNGRTATTPISG